MNEKLKHHIKKLILGELKKLLDEFRQVRSLRLVEGDLDSTRSKELAKQMESAREKLDALKRIQRREKEVQDRCKEIDHDNKSRNGKPQGSPRR